MSTSTTTTPGSLLELRQSERRRRIKNGLNLEGWHWALEEKPIMPDSTTSLTSEEQAACTNNIEQWRCHYSKAFPIFFAQLTEYKSVLVAYNLPKAQYDDTGFTTKHYAALQLISITLSSCNNEFGTYIQSIIVNQKKQSNWDCKFRISGSFLFLSPT